MSRRDIFVNALLGIFLLLAFFACVAAIALAVWCGFLGLEWILRRVAPGLPHPAVFVLVAIWTLSMIWSGVQHARKRRWRNAFLFFATPMGWALVVDVQASVGSIRGNWILYCLLPLVMVLGIAGDAAMGRLKFFVAATIISAVVSVNSGLLGNAALSRTIATSTLAVTLIWFCIDIVRNRYGTKTPNHSPVLPSAGV